MTYHIRSHCCPNSPAMFHKDGTPAYFNSPAEALKAVSEDMEDYIAWDVRQGDWFRCVDESGQILWTLVIRG